MVVDSAEYLEGQHPYAYSHIGGGAASYDHRADCENTSLICSTTFLILGAGFGILNSGDSGASSTSGIADVAIIVRVGFRRRDI